MRERIRVAVLMSTYNGQQYVKEQVHSILSQDVDSLRVDIHLYIRDDGSKDNTVNILNELSEQYASYVTLNTNEPGNIGVKKSFFSLINDGSIHADYFFLSDQDDIWKPDKVKQTLSIFEKNASTLPVGVYSDLWLADASGVSVGKRMSEQAQWPKDLKVDYKYLSFDYRVTGAAFAFNQTARTLFNQIPDGFISLVNMHDSFLALILSVCGKLIQIDQPLVLYRQHGDNLIGGVKKKRNLLEAISFKKREEGQLIVDNLLLSAFLKKNKISIDEKFQKTLNLYNDYFDRSYSLLFRVKNSFRIYKIMHHKRKRTSFMLISAFDVTKSVSSRKKINTALM
ncbi:glycosyltransferase family 2 protein [Lacticaseibacillus paracasei]|uniref:glycosyltransferase family 2 protein n=1 Tax=Lacticaseibacillus paracasei TaxID=1597 RepID=UPI0021A9A4E7|nr:glycosyltransferase family 2 protein [Lacticaseibacillus paracasei]MCT4393863.1 glycosyltransferase family 2 protein [Lacticaseibacillus paracasei]WBS98063.1 glycosyltransferase family 2 protein [Lacticaseibacillus paracasei]